jgi:ferric-dicitrate binding protein FerR (iron transport regulator)
VKASAKSASAVKPYLTQLLSNQDVQENAGRAVRAAQDVYARARGKDAVEVASDKKLQRRVREAAGAARQALSAASEPPPKPKRRRGRKLAGIALVGAGVFLALNADARAKLLGLMGQNASPADLPVDVEGDVSVAGEGGDGV